MGISVDVTGDLDLSSVQELIVKLSDAGNRNELLDLIGAEAESQTHRRIRDEKTAPDGTPWPEWSDNYAKTRHGNQSLLMGSGELDDSIQYQVRDENVYLGSALVYSSVHQEGFDAGIKVKSHTRLIRQAFGKVLNSPVLQTVKSHVRHMKVPQREYMGLSDENKDDIEGLIFDFYGDLLQ